MDDDARSGRSCEDAGEAVQRRLQREAVDEWIAAAEAEHGPVDPAEVEAKAERIRAHHRAHRGDSA